MRCVSCVAACAQAYTSHPPPGPRIYKRFNYPATLTNYNNSSLQGINAAKTLLTNEVSACPNEKIVLLGYSQGAHVVTDVIAGGHRSADSPLSAIRAVATGLLPAAAALLVRARHGALAGLLTTRIAILLSR